jgi:purine-nucleoside phosphorylase
MAAVTDHLPTPKPSSEAYQRASGSADFIRSKLPSHLQKPRVAIVCGSGLGGIADTVTADTKLEIDYHDIPNFPKTTGEFHDRSRVTHTDKHISSRTRRQACRWHHGRSQSLGCLVSGQSTVSQWKGNCVIGCDAHSYFLSSFYEGHTMELVTFATRVCKVLGVETMIGMSLVFVSEKVLTRLQ